MISGADPFRRSPTVLWRRSLDAVVVLPTGGLRLVRSDRQDTTPVLFDLLGLGALGCALGWLVATALWWTWQEQAAPPSWSSGAAALGAVLSSLLGRWRMR